MAFAPAQSRFAVQAASVRSISIDNASPRIIFCRPRSGLVWTPRASRLRIVLFSNEISRWGNTDGRDEDAGVEDDGFEKDTARTMLRILTARATQRLLMQLQELDLHVAHWLSDFCSRNAPTGGDKFLLALLNEPGADLMDTPNKTSHIVSPADLADRILATRTDMAQRIGSNFPQFVQQEGIDLKVRHLSKSLNGSGARRR